MDSPGKPQKKVSSGFLVILLKIGPKLLPILTKLIKVTLSFLKGGAVVKGAGAAASIGLYSYLFSWQMGISLVAFIFIHEYGHYWAMKKCGIKTKGIYLIPGFGGAAVAAEGFKSARNEAYIAVMGPLFGLFFIVPMIALYFVFSDPMYAAIASLMALINLFNLLPINPLDGGRIVKALLYSFKASFGFFFMFFSLALAGVMAWKLGLALLAYIAIIGIFETLSDYGLLEAMKNFSKTALRIFLGYVAYLMIVILFWAYNTGGITVGVVFATILLLFLFTALILDMYRCTQANNNLAFLYPVEVVRQFFKGIAELFSIKASQLKRPDGYEQMNGKGILMHSFAYIFTIILMVSLIWFASSMPGAHHAKEMLM